MVTPKQSACKAMHLCWLLTIRESLCEAKRFMIGIRGGTKKLKL